MVRTKADSVPGTYRKAVAAQAPRKSFGASSANHAASSSSQCNTPAKGKYAGGNPVCARPTPTWQKGIGDFFGGPPRKPETEDQENMEPEAETVEDGEQAGGSGVAKTKGKGKGKKASKKMSSPEPQSGEGEVVEDGEQAGGSGVAKGKAKKTRKSKPLPAEDEDED